MAPTYRDPAERSGYLRWFYRDWRPTRLGRLVNGALAWLSGPGLTPRVLLTLQVKGRRSGRLRTNVLVVARHEGQRYLVSMLGEGSESVQRPPMPCREAFRCPHYGPGVGREKTITVAEPGGALQKNVALPEVAAMYCLPAAW